MTTVRIGRRCESSDATAVAATRRTAAAGSGGRRQESCSDCSWRACACGWRRARGRRVAHQRGRAAAGRFTAKRRLSAFGSDHSDGWRLRCVPAGSTSHVAASAHADGSAALLVLGRGAANCCLASLTVGGLRHHARGRPAARGQGRHYDSCRQLRQLSARYQRGRALVCVRTAAVPQQRWLGAVAAPRRQRQQQLRCRVVCRAPQRLVFAHSSSISVVRTHGQHPPPTHPPSCPLTTIRCVCAPCLSP